MLVDRYTKERYIVVQEFMVRDLHLKGNDLLVYAIIYGFSQDGEQAFSGSLGYLAEWTSSTKQGIMKNLNNLIERNLIKKTEENKNGVRNCKYTTNIDNGM